MGDDILTRIIEVEKEIQARVAAEKKSVQDWLAQVKLEVEKEMEAEEARLKESCDRAVESAAAEAQRRASEILSEATALSEKLAGLSDAALEGIVLRHLGRVLPHRRGAA